MLPLKRYAVYIRNVHAHAYYFPGSGQIRRDLEMWARTYGPVYRIQILHREIVVVSDLDALQEVLVRRGMDFAGRPSYFRMDYLLERTGLNNTEPDALWKTLRKLSQRYLRQFGEGMSRLEDIISVVSEDLFQKFAAHENEPLDPREAISEATLKTISVLIVGEILEPGNRLYENLRSFERAIFKGVSHASVDYMLLDMFPFLIHFPLSSSRDLKRVTWIKSEIWKDIRGMVEANPDRECFARLMLMAVRGETMVSDKEDVQVEEKDARMNCLILLNAGHATTTMTFYALLNILAHHPEVQTRIADEISQAVAPGENVSLRHKSALPYTNATIFELLRYFTTLPTGVARRATRDSTILGTIIPKDTWIFNNFWTLHHSENHWSKPDRFCPERFLDDQNELVTADHPNRKHVMSFSAGPRVCLGEQLARTRLFLWTANVMPRFVIVPADGNTPDMVAAESFYEELILRPPAYQIHFKPR